MRSIGDARVLCRKDVEEQYLTHVPHQIGVHTASGAEAKNQTTGGQRRRTARSGECSIDYWSPGDEEKHKNHGHRCASQRNVGSVRGDEGAKVRQIVRGRRD